MDDLSYTFLNILFFVPVIVIFWFGFYWRIFFKRLKFMMSSAVIGILYFFVVDLPATTWRAWEFDYNKTLGVTIENSVIEELIWVVLVFVTVALMIEVIIEVLEKKHD